MAKPNAQWLQNQANKLRITILEMAVRAGGGHIGGAYSILDVMTALYFRILRHDPANPTWSQRDRLLYSKGHGCLALYTLLAETGYFEKERLETFCKDSGAFAGHPERELIPGVEATTGSLGHGLSLGVGMALSFQKDRLPHRVFVVLSDGECNEGSVWEAAMAGPQFKLEQLTAIFDSNKYESLGRVSEIMSVEPLGERLRTFGWAVREINGHNMEEILQALENLPIEPGRPSAIVAHTIKGKGVSFMENVPMWHYRAPTADEARAAYRELEANLT